MTDAFRYQNGELVAESVSVRDLAERYGTPLYVYSRSRIRDRYRALAAAFSGIEPSIFYAVKSNTCAAVIATLAAEGAGADVVSGGELLRAKRAGIPTGRMVFAGVGKTVDEIDLALREGILYFTVESEPELERISERATALGLVGRVAIRVNPDVDPKTHRFTSTGMKENKFGVDPERAERACLRAAELPGLEAVGLHMHIGSPVMQVDPYLEAIDLVAPICARLREQIPTFRHLDIGGGFGIPYRPEEAPFDLDRFAKEAGPRLRDVGLSIGVEPGRFITGDAGILVTRVQYVKENAFKTFLIADAAMTDLIRPALYEAWHEVMAVRETSERVTGDVVGPVCESSDFMAQDRELPASRPGDLLAVMNAGAYGFGMASNYNSRPRPAEVMVQGDRADVVRERETFEDLVRGERIPAWE